MKHQASRPLVATVFMAMLVAGPAKAAEGDEPVDLPRVKAAIPFMPLCQGATCDSLRQAILVMDWDYTEQELFAEGGGVQMTKEQFCAEMKNHPPADCDADNPPSTPAYDPNWASSGCGDGSFQAKFAEVALRLKVDNYQNDLNNPLPGISFLGACQLHDRCYGSMLPKTTCDSSFRISMNAACSAGSATYLSQCQSLAAGFEGAVSMFGQDSYNAAQQARECAAYAADLKANGCD